MTKRHTTLKWKVSLNSNDAIACVHIGKEVGDLSPEIYAKILNAYQKYEQHSNIIITLPMDLHKGISTTFIFMLDTTKNIYVEIHDF